MMMDGDFNSGPTQVAKVAEMPLDRQSASVLFEKAEALELPGRTYMTRTELIEALLAA